jgi:hypothetical protein
MSDPTLDRMALMKREWDAWQEIVKASDGVTITKEDWAASTRNFETPGRRLIEAIRQWGDRLAELRQKIAAGA